MPQNPKAVAIRSGHEAQRDYEAGMKKLDILTRKRAAAIRKCLATGCTLGETAGIFNVSRSRIQQLAKLPQDVS